MSEQSCTFCRIIHENAPTSLIYQDELVTAFNDIRPITPVHILVVPNQHITSLNEISPDEESLIGHMVCVAKTLAKEYHIDQSGYRLVINTGPHAGQSVYHLHLHLIGGRRMPFKFQ